MIVCGREEPGFTSIPDRPEAGLGPLGGLNAALAYAAQHDFAGCDIPNLPADLMKTLDGKGAAFVQSQPVVGLWPVELADELERFVQEGGRALYAFAERVHARQVRFAPKLLNVNRPEDLPPKA